MFVANSFNELGYSILEFSKLESRKRVTFFSWASQTCFAFEPIRSVVAIRSLLSIPGLFDSLIKESISALVIEVVAA